MISPLKYTLRQLRSNTLFTLVKILSLIIGFSVLIILLSLVRGELSYDKFWSNRDQLYRIAMDQYQDEELTISSAKSYRGLPGLLKEELPEVLDMTRLLPDIITVFVGEQQIQDVKMFYADTNIFKVIPRTIIRSESLEVFPELRSMAISEDLALKLYGTIDCLGEELKLNEGWIFYISTVFETIPEESHIHFDVLMNLPSLFYYMNNFDNESSQLVEMGDFSYTDPGPYHPRSWNNMLCYNYLLVSERTNMESLQEKANKLLKKVELPDRIRSATIVPVFHRVDQIHLRSDFPNEIESNGSMFHVYMLILIAIVVLVVSWINFMNLFAVAFKEGVRVVAIRMIFGAERSHIRREVLAKAVLLSLTAAIIVALLAWGFHHLLEAYSFGSMDLILLIVLVLTTAVLSVLIPISSFQSGRIISQLKGEIFGGQKGNWYRRLMVLIQFTSSVVLISMTLVIYSQMKYASKAELGFDSEHVVYSFSPMTMNQRPDKPAKLILFRQKMEAIPGLSNFCVSSSIPGAHLGFQGLNMSFTSEEGEHEAYLQRLNVDANYFDLYGIKFLAGRDFRSDPRYNVGEIVLNRLAVSSLGMADPESAVGMFIRAGDQSYEVVGVVEDYHHNSLKDGLLPLVFFKRLRWNAAVGYYSFKLESIQTETLDRLALAWEETYPGENFIYNIQEETYEAQYEAEQNFMNSFMLAALLALIISSLGLLAFARYNAIKRTREIGIRKTYGSDRARILKLLHKESIVLVLVASAMGIPLSWLIVSKWLLNFSYRIDPSWWMFLISAGITMVVAMLTTFIQTSKASRLNPVEALKYE